MKKIASNVQSLLSASNQINNHSKAVEELVYNALDAGATAMAIRINIQENTIQVIDNGSGVYREDFNSIGKKYMTSKLFDLSALKIAAPDKYGFHGQFLANLTNISKSVKLVSRHEKSEETWMKLFEYGKEKQIKIFSRRPSKGTTVEVRGFLYNLNIQRNSHSILCELQNIKTFLEHLSIVHNNISLSLRDDSKNKIVFKIHKNRDIYQTLSTLYNIEKKDFQELQVEKHEYKVTGLLGNCENGTGKHFIFLNGKFVTSTSKLHKVMNNNLMQEINLRGHTNQTEENHLFLRNIPDYIIFIKCPYMDYNLSTSANQVVLEFKDWNQINKILEKLAKFFKGNLNLKEKTEIEKSKTIDKAESNETREQVKKIMEKILGNKTKKPGISHMQNGIKGKQIKRKVKKSTEATNIKLINLKKHSDKIDKAIKNKDVTNKNNKIDYNQNIKDIHLGKENITNQESNIKIYSKPCSNDLAITHHSKIKKVFDNNKLKSNEMHQQKKFKTKVKKTKKPGKYNDEILRKFEINSDSLNRRCNELEQKTRNLLDQKHAKTYKHLVSKNLVNHIISKNNKNRVILKQIETIPEYKQKIPKHNLQMNNHHEIVREKALPSNYDLLQTILKSQRKGQISNETCNFVPVMEQQPKTTIHKAHKPINTESKTNLPKTMVTFQSHNYYTNHNMNLENNANAYNISNAIQMSDNENNNFHKRKRTFITKESRENFAIPKKSYKNHIFKERRMKAVLSKELKSNIKRLFDQTSKLFDLRNQILGNSEESTRYTIEFTKSDIFKVPTDRKVAVDSHNISINPTMNIEEIQSESVNYNHISVNTGTYTVSNVKHKGYTINDYNWNLYGTYTVEHSNEIFSLNKSETYYNNIAIEKNCSNRNIYISESQENSPNQQTTDPLNVCETVLNNQETPEQIDNLKNLYDNIVLNSQEVLEKEFEFSFNNREANLLNKNNDHQRRCDNFFDNENEQDHEIVEDFPYVEKLYPEDIFQEVSHHFSLPNGNIGENSSKEVNRCPLPNKTINTKQNISENKQRTTKDVSNPISSENCNLGDFNLKNRLGFVPKGMSQIFENCRTKNVLEYDVNGDYYENEMYVNFLDNVRNNAEIFEPKIQEPKERTTKAIDKVNAKLNKDNSSLKFDAKSLKHAKVLGQIDEKFIATIINGRCDKEALTDFLVLFDQHAVHERIRLENNLLDYFNHNQWKPVNVDEINLKISKDDILYLHNYKDKFEQLGLRWAVLDTYEVSFSCIAEAILGKNPRPVQMVLKAVKNLIAEEINIIKTQGGCVSLYPKSIMDLVFSEACRYAIKFGDKLSKNECVDLLNMLSDCKTPFQCAHGRPVMGVIMDIKIHKVEYKMNLNKIMEWKEVV